MQSLGFSYDWSREVATCDVSYYKWTQVRWPCKKHLPICAVVA
jgi:hypothetical protein